MAFQAKDIQEILRIPKIRYEYLARQINIKPDIEEGEGTGRAHKFSFKNLMQFAIAERCSLNGLSMKQIRFLSKIIYKHANPDIFKQPSWSKNMKAIRIKDASAISKEEIAAIETREAEKEKAFIKFEVWFYGVPGGGLFYWEGEEIDLCFYNALTKKMNENLVDYYAYPTQLITNPEIIDQLKTAIRHDTKNATLANVMNGFDACIRVNVGKIRDNLSHSIGLRQSGIIN